MPAPAGAQEPAPDSPSTLSVSAQATVTRAPDRARVHLAVETVAATAREATDANAASMTAVLDALARLGIDPDDVRTQSVTLNPRYDRGAEDREPAIVGYQAANRVTVPVTPVDDVGPVVDAAVAAGANRVTGIEFEIGDPEAAYHEALRRAIARAQRDADVAAAALGQPLGPAVSVSTGGLDAPVPRPMMEAMDLNLRAAGTPVQAGELDVRAFVSITYRLGS
ncbi:MAG: SIMPL domain-containing protein [Gemmatimonadota bacterium]